MSQHHAHYCGFPYPGHVWTHSKACPAREPSPVPDLEKRCLEHDPWNLEEYAQFMGSNYRNTGFWAVNSPWDWIRPQWFAWRPAQSHGPLLT